MDISVIVEGQRMKLAANQNHHIEGSNEFVKFKFNFSNEWNGLAIHAQFVQNGKNYGGIISGGYTYLPYEIKAGTCKMVLWGVDGDVRATTNYITLTIGEDITVLQTLSEDINRTDYEEAIKSLNSYIKNGGVSESALQAEFSKAIADLVNPDSIKEQVMSSITAAKQGIDTAKSAIESAKSEIESSVSEAKEYSLSAKESSENATNTFEEVKSLKSDVDTALSSANTAVQKAEAALSTANDAVKARDEIIGAAGTAENPSDGSALYEIREARELILGDNGIVPQVTALKNETVSARDTTLDYKNKAETAKSAIETMKASVDSSKESVDNAHDEIFGEGGSLSNLGNGALKEVRETKTSIENFNKSGGSLEQARTAASAAIASANAAESYKNSAKSSEDNASLSADNASKSENAVKAVENKIDQANTSAAQIEAFRTEMETAHDETITARDDILNPGTDGKSTYEKIIEADTNITNAKNLIVGSSGTAENPADNSALKIANTAAANAAQSAKEAAESAKSANQGIKVADDLLTDSNPTLTALSAKQGKLLNESKLDKSGDTMTGKLTLDGAPTENLHAATKKYVDDNVYTHPSAHPATMITEDSSHRFVSDSEKETWNSKADGTHNHDTTYLELSGGTLSGDLTLSGEPTSDNMAATKKYVDDHVYSLPIAGKTALGGIKVGTNLSISEDGTLSADAQKMTVDTTITEGSANAVSSSAVFARIGNLKFVVASEAPTTADENTITLIVEG